MLKLKLQYFGHLMQRADSLAKTLMLGKIEGGRRRGWQDEMIQWYHWLNGHEFEQAPGGGEGQESLVCYSALGRKESDMTEQQHDSRKCYQHPCIRDWCTEQREKEQIWVVVRWMNLQPVIQSEVSQKEKNKYHILTHNMKSRKWHWWMYLQGRNGKAIENKCMGTCAG